MTVGHILDENSALLLAPSTLIEEEEKKISSDLIGCEFLQSRKTK
jgi:hypothetical protein